MNYNDEDDLELNNEPEENLSQDSRSMSNEAANTAKREIQKKLSKSVTKNAVKQSLVKALLPVLTWVLVFIIILIIIIGIVMFFITMPGMVMDKLKDLSISIGNKLEAFFGGDTTAQIQDQQVYDVLDYLEQMGYDLKGYGFLTDYVGESKDGVERNDEGKIKEAKSDFIYTYLVSDNYVYTIANFNQTNDLANNGHRILGAIVSVFQKVGNLFTNGQLGQFWGRGMISVYHESSIGVPGTYYGGFGDLIGWSGIKINIDEEKDEKTLQVRRGWGSGVKSFNLDGWTGRYGMPIDFLLSVHLATMMPDLAYDMVESFDTQIVMLLHKTGSYLEGTASYDPYIAYVKNHWYRDVYFVQTDREFVDYDYEYESVMKERWTLYETYPADDPERAGEYKLYEINDDGTYKTSGGEYILFDGTADEAEKNGVKVAKKAQTIKYSNNSQFEEIEWNKNSWGIWTAYKINSSGSLTQTGEGLRTETNPEIKKMFLNNRYFRYDGSVETAEVIDKLRENINPNTNYYGPVKGIGPDGNEVDYTSVTAVVDGETKKVEDFSGEVSLNQDSLNAFSMLENEHTLDADYIYRDFKELIVELGYFEKEELTDETPRLLQFIIPKISSYGYPIRSLDKRENEFGTMAHSKYDYKDFKAQDNTNNEIVIDGVLEDGKGNPLGATTTENKSDYTYARTSEVKKLSSIDNLENTSNADVLQNVGSANRSLVTDDFDDAGWSDTKAIVEQWVEKLNITTIGNYYTKGNEKEYEKFLDTLGGIFSRYGGKDKIGDGTGDALKDAGEYCYGLMNMLGFNYCAYTGGSDYDFGRCTMFGNNLSLDAYPNFGNSIPHHDHDGGLPKKIDDCMLKQRFVTNCNYTTDKVYYKAGLIGGENQPATTLSIDSMLNEYGGKPVFEISELHFGDLIQCYESNGNNSTNPADWTGWYHIMYVGEETEDTITIYQTGHDYTNDASWRVELKKNSPRSAMPAASGWVGIHVWDLEYPEKYEGYLGNEDVVSPVTGILLDYGTYTNEIDTISDTEYRENVDYKYKTESLLNKDRNNNVTTDQEIPVDKVGYAKILVLDKENYLKLEKSTNSKWKNNSLLTESNNFRDDLQKKEDIDSWSDIDKTVYGYKEYAELYDKYGISGYVIYIDGFKCSLPGDLNDGIVTNDKKIDWDYFEKVTPSNLNLDSKDKLKSLYEKDEEYKLSSKTETEKLNAETKIKDVASPSLYTDKLYFIKEGTVIGRTLTDKELLEDPAYRNKEFGTYEEIRENPDSEISVIGNYLRVIMRDLDGTVVENVEDYMKLDTPDDKNKRNLHLCDDYDVSDKTNFVTAEEFRIMFADRKNILDNTDAFIEMQEKYQVSAVFAACVTIIESGGGTAWAAIDPSTHNWFSIKGSYRGHSLNGWRSYPSFAAAVDDFGDLIANAPYYYKRNNFLVSQIGPIYCGEAWVEKVNAEMTFRYKKILK